MAHLIHSFMKINRHNRMIGANELCANLSCKRRTQLEAQGKYWRWTFFWFEITDNTLCKYFFKEYIYIKKKQIQSINKYSKAARNDRYLQISPKKKPNNIQIKSVYVNITCKKKQRWNTNLHYRVFILKKYSTLIIVW